MYDNRSMDYDTARHPISYVARITGLSTHVIRMWERRYEAVVPLRTNTQRRLYRDADIDRLRLMRALVEAGHSIGQVAGMRTDTLREMLRGSSAPPIMSPASPSRLTGDAENSSELSRFMARCQEAVLELDAEGLHETLVAAQVKLSLPVLLEKLISPLLVWVGESWHEGTLRVAHEHLCSATVKAFLLQLRQSMGVEAEAPRVAIATPSGEQHELGALLAATAAAAEGWRALYFGPNLPAAELANAAVAARVRAAAMSIAVPGDLQRIVQEIGALRRYLPAAIPLVLGGAGAARNRVYFEDPGIQCVSTLLEFQSALRIIQG